MSDRSSRDRRSNRSRDVGTRSRRGRDGRGQSHVVGVALLLGATVIAMGTLTAGIGTVVEYNAASADAGRVAEDLDGGLEAVATTGRHRSTVAFTDGRVRVVARDLRVLNGTGTSVDDVRRRVRIDALVFEGDDRRRVAALGGAVIRGQPGNAWLHAAPPLTLGEDVVVIGAVRLNASNASVAGTGGVTVPLRTRVTHERTALGAGRYWLAIETATPGPWERYVAEAGLSTKRRDLDGDGVPSVIVRLGRVKTAYLVVHDLALEVG